MNTSLTQYKISDFLEWQRGGQLVLRPWFQRRDVWRPGAKSYLIDTIIRDYPTPPIFLRNLSSDLKSLKSQREVVDGQQRLRTIISFIDPNLIHDYKSSRDDFTILRAHIPEAAGKGFRELSNDLQQKILDYSFPVTIFSSDTDDTQILEVFARMNATGVALNAQELRNAKYYGEFRTSVYALAAEKLEFWLKCSLFSKSQVARMKEVEMVSDLCILIINGITQKSKTVIDRYYEDYDEEYRHHVEVEKRFRITLQAIESFWKPTYVKIFANQTLFYGLFAVVYDYLYGLGSQLQRSRRPEIENNVLAKMFKRAQNILAGEVPTSVRVAATTRTSNAINRKNLVKYLAAG